MHKDPTPPRRLNKRITPGMEAVIMKALSKNPRDRYFSADAMLDDIEIEVPPKSSGTTEAPKSARHKARGGGLVLASVVALLLILGGGAALASGLVGLPLEGGVADTLSRMNPVETKPPTPPQSAQGTEAASESQTSTGETSGESGSQNVAAVGEATSRTPEQPEMVPVPDVTAFYDYFAADRLENKGFDVRFVYDYHEGFAPRGVTWATDPAVGTLAPVGSTVTVYATPKDLPLPPRLR